MRISTLTTAIITAFILLTNNGFSQEQTEINKELAAKFSTLINTSEKCEAYPFLSSDGLRLYFTSDREGGFGRIYFCSRNSVSENFNEPKQLSQQLPDGHYSATLTADELIIYTAFEGEIYTAKRRSLNDDFSKPFKIEGLIEGRKYAPSISSDGSELIVITDEEDTNYDIAIHYRKNAAGNFIEAGRIYAPGKTEIDPGQFSKDGLSFYASYETSSEGDAFTQKIIRYKRASLNDNFTISEEMPQLNSSMRNHQPTMNADETIFIVTNSAKDLWEENELRLINFNNVEFIAPATIQCGEITIDTINCFKEFIFEDFVKIDFLPFRTVCYLYVDTTFVFEEVCERETTTIESVVKEVPETNVKVKVYPNPFTNNILITLGEKETNSTLDLYDISGRKILTTKLNNTSNRIQFNQPGAGVYIYKITDKTGKLITSGKLVKK